MWLKLRKVDSGRVLKKKSILAEVLVEGGLVYPFLDVFGRIL